MIYVKCVRRTHQIDQEIGALNNKPLLLEINSLWGSVSIHFNTPYGAHRTHHTNHNWRVEKQVCNNLADEVYSFQHILRRLIVGCVHRTHQIDQEIGALKNQ
jgi:hypothetical protein